MRRIKKIFIIVKILLVVFPSLIVTQTNITTEILSVRDGLSNNYVHNIIQDQYGYMWFATSDGLNVYDGYQISIFKNIPDDTTSLPHNHVHRLLEDTNGIIWATTENGLARYNRKSKTFNTFRYSVSNTEGSNRVFDIFEDSRGKLWVSTRFGTFEFDRPTEKFISYDVMLTDNNIIEFPSAYTGNIFENSSGELFHLTWPFGLVKYDYDASLFVQVALKDDFHRNLEQKVFFSTLFDQEGNLYIGHSNGLVKIDINENIGYDITPFKRNPSVTNFRYNAVSGLFLDRNQNILVGTGRHGMLLYDTKSQKFETLINSPSTFFGRFYEDKSGLLWFGSSRGAHKYDYDRKPFEKYVVSDEFDEDGNKAVIAFSPSLILNNKVWLGTREGVSIFDTKNNSISKYPGQFSGLSKFDSLAIPAIVENSDGRLWLATNNDGLFSYNLKSKIIKNYKNSLYDNSTLIDNEINCLTIDNDENLWIGTDQGLHFQKQKENEIIRIPSLMYRKYHHSLIDIINTLRKQNKPINTIINVGDYADITREFVIREEAKTLIYSMGEGLQLFNMVDYGWLESGSGDTVWSSADYEETFHASGANKNRIKIGLLNLKPGRYKLRYLSDDSHSAQSYNRVPPQDSTYWGVQIFSLTDGEFENMQQALKESEEKSYLANEDIRTIFQDSKNNIWVGTNGGLSEIDSSYHIENYFNIPSEKKSLSSERIRDITEDLAGNIWIATANGLNKFNPSEKTFSIIGESDGLPSTNLSAVELDDNGHLWVSGLKGISKIELDENGSKQIIVNYDVKDGLQGYEFINDASFKDKSGRLYFSGFYGFNAFYPGNSNKTKPFLALQDIKVSNTSIVNMENYEDVDYNQLSDFSLSHNQNDLSFEFASIHFSRPDKNRIMYKMDGIDEKWIVSSRRFASYTNLSPGDYVFNLRGSNGDGIWSEEIRSINIHISAPWYNNWVAYSIYTVLFFGFLFSVRKFEMNRQRKNVQIKESRLKIEAAEALAKAAESDKRALQVEYEHKKKELEEARELQLSMLPKQLPELPNLDIAVYMKTATEVGGDYYDFHIDMNGTLTVVLGDATGHGMKAGTMVTTTKSLFNVLAPNPNIVETFHEMTRCLKLMQMQNLSMCMSMLKILGNKVTMSAAGMPPIFIYKRENQSTEEHVIKGMPLGTFNNFPYSTIKSELNSGDVILLTSDGFPELQGENDEIYGYKRLRNLFEDLADESPEEIITNLKNAGSKWVNDKDPDDDVTFVVIKVK